MKLVVVKKIQAIKYGGIYKALGFTKVALWGGNLYLLQQNFTLNTKEIMILISNKKVLSWWESFYGVENFWWKRSSLVWSNFH